MMKPCTKCLEARRAAKNTAARLLGNMTRRTLYQTNHGDMLVDRQSGRVIDAANTMSPTIKVNDKVYITSRAVYKLNDMHPTKLDGYVVHGMKNM